MRLKSVSKRIGLSLVLIASFPAVSPALTNNIALTPQMGWNDWNSYGCGISQAAVTNTAGVIAANGMKAAGYWFINIDDGWASSRDANGVIQAYPTKFPDGIQWLADYVHARGLKLGIYTDHGTNTCSSCISGATPPKQPGSFNHEYIDAFTYASWDVDYLKNDSCNLPLGNIPHDDYFRMADGLRQAGQPIFVSLCPNAAHYEYWSPDVGNSWRTTGDIHNTFASMISKIDQNSKSAYLAGPGRWNDPDMLEIGNGEFVTNLVGAQTHFTMWCIMAAPLIAGNNVTTMSAATLAILTNDEAIAVDQDPAGEQGEFVGGLRDSAEVWSKPLGYDFTTRAVALLNRSASTPATITCYWTNLAFPAGTTATVRDLWTHQDLGTFTDSFTATVPAYGSRLLKIIGTPIAPPSPGTNYLTTLQPLYAYCGWGAMTNNRSIGGNPLTLDGVVYTNGIGTHAIGGNEYNLGGVVSRFHATVGVDDEVGANGSVIFQVIADGRKIYDSGILTGGGPSKTVDLDLTGVRRLTIGVTDTGNDVSGNRNSNDHCDWADAYVVVTNPVPQVPETPAGLTARTGNSIALDWNDTLAALTYNVKRATRSGGPYTIVANTPLTQFADSNVVAGTTYYYVLSAVSSFGEGSNSPEVSAAPCLAPSAPTNLVAAVETNSTVALSWNASAGASSYTVSRFTGSTPPVVIATGLTATNLADTNVVAGTTYYYLVSAANGCSESGYSSFAAATVVDFSTPPTWNGGSLAGDNWSDAANWDGVAIAPGNSLEFAGNLRLQNTNDTPAGTSYSAIQFDPGAGAFVLNGNPVSISGSISNNSSAQQVVTLGLNFAGGLSLAGASNLLLIAGALTNTLASGSGTVTLTGDGVLNDEFAGGTNIIATAGDANWTLLDNAAGTATSVPWIFSINSGVFTFGSDSSAPTLTTTTPNNAPSDHQVGTVAGATGTFNLAGGVLTTASRLNTATALNSTGVVNQTGGTFNLGSQFQGANGGNAGEMSIVNFSGGTMNVAGGGGPFFVASRGDGVLNLSDSALLNCGTLDLARNADGNAINCSGTVNLDGGTLAVNRVGTATANSQTGVSFGPAATFNFNGGTLKAKAGAANFFQGSTTAPIIPITAIVKVGGAIIDDGGNSIGVLEPLQHDPALGSTPDGGLTKNGSGTVTLGAGATYTGNTVVNGGTLAFASDFSLNPGAALVLAVDKSATPSNAVLQVSGQLNCAGVLIITNAGTVPFAAGDRFQLFGATTISGAFAQIVPAIPGLNLAWDTRNLGNGILDVVSSPTPSPKINSVRLNGPRLILGGTNGVVNWPFYVLSSTNLALPLNDWERVGSNTFDSFGNFNFTNPVDPAPAQLFYLLELK